MNLTDVNHTRRKRIKIQLDSQSEVIERLMKIGLTPGLSLAVICENEVIMERGYGYSDLHHQVHATPSTIFPIASITKGFTAAACGILVAEGKLSWDQPISTYIPGFNPINDPELASKGTLIDILSHQTGLQDEPTLYCGPNGLPLTTEEDIVLSTINSMSTSHGRYKRFWSYNPLPYALITRVIEKASGMNLADFLSTRIFQPLGMDSTSLVGFQPVACTLSKPYTAMSSGEIIERRVPDSAYHFPFDSSMGIQSSVPDLMKWVKAIISAYRDIENASDRPSDSTVFALPEMKTILKPWCPLPPNAGGNPAYCLGWFLHTGNYIFDEIFDIGDVDRDRGQISWSRTLLTCNPHEPPRQILYHSGVGNGFTSSLHIYPEEGDAVIVLGNSSYSGDVVARVSVLLTTILCGQGLSVKDLEMNTKQYSDSETERWKAIKSNLSCQQRQKPQATTVHASEILGKYINDAKSLTVTIESDDQEGIFEMTELGPPIGARIKFGSVSEPSLSLWNFCQNTLCFLPSEKDYQSWGMCYMAHWSQYLLHLQHDVSARHISGLWWQYNENEDGIWLSWTG